MNTIIGSALVCAAQIMQLPVPLVIPVVIEHREPTPAECGLTTRSTCGAVIWGNTPSVGQYRIVTNHADHWPTMVHEACHILQTERDGRMTEPECDQVQADAWTCEEDLWTTTQSKRSVQF